MWEYQSAAAAAETRSSKWWARLDCFDHTSKAKTTTTTMGKISVIVEQILLRFHTLGGSTISYFDIVSILGNCVDKYFALVNNSLCTYRSKQNCDQIWPNFVTLMQFLWVYLLFCVSFHNVDTNKCRISLSCLMLDLVKGVLKQKPSNYFCLISEQAKN